MSRPTGMDEMMAPMSGAISAAELPDVHDTSGVRPSLENVGEADLAWCFRQCAGLTARRARNFHYGLRLTPQPRRSSLYAIYAWMRTGDDIADAPNPLEYRRVQLAQFRQNTELALSGDLDGVLYGTSGFRRAAGAWWAEDIKRVWLWAALVATVRSYRLDHAIVRDMLDGLDEDLACPEYVTDADLSRYCYRVAGTAGLACVSIWGLRAGASAEKARELALRRGQAFQRTNILRDLAQDYDALPRRVYLPRESFESHGLSAEGVRRWVDPRRCEAMIRAHAAEARRFYELSSELENLVAEECASTLWAMTRIYSGVLEVIERYPFRIVSDRRVRLSSMRKLSIAVRASLGMRGRA